MDELTVLKQETEFLEKRRNELHSAIVTEKLIQEQKEINKSIKKELKKFAFIGLSVSTQMKYNIALEKFDKIYEGNYDDFTEVMKVIEDYTDSCKKTILCVLLKMTCNDKYRNELTKINEIIEEKQNTKEEFSIDYDSIVKKYNEIPDNVLKLIFTLVIYYPNVRASDYFSIKIKNIDKKNDNYYSKGIVVFNKLCKVKSQKITIGIVKEHKELFDKVLKNNKEDFLFEQNFKCASFVKMLTKFSKHYFNIKSFSCFRKLIYYKQFSKRQMETVRRFTEINRSQNHSTNTALKYYTKK